ncbi:MAG: gamma-glutamyl-gamma-aminobutyrate hydrolase family protein [Longimicrobiales bacterium]
MSTVVAITTSTVSEGGEWRRPQIALYTDYFGALERSGLIGLPVTPAHSKPGIRRLLECCSGLVLSGGEDVDPARYGEDPLPELGRVNPQRDAMEFEALEVALEMELPVLGICRGAQVLNVYRGGTLYQDLEAQRPDELQFSHRQEEWFGRTHSVSVERDTKLGQILGTTELMTNSFHHQAVKDVGTGLVVSARTENGLVEALEDPSRGWVIGVQWHPERHEAEAPNTDPDRRLLAAFRDAAVAYGGD